MGAVALFGSAVPRRGQQFDHAASGCDQDQGADHDLDQGETFL
jgi:hypothetical protein